MGVRQAEAIASLLRSGELPWNRAFAGEPILVPEDGPLPRIELPGGLTITLLSPTPNGLASLASAWEGESRKSGHVPGEAPLLKSNESTEHEDSFDVETGANETVISPLTSLESVDLNELANAPFQENRNRVSASSIAFLVEHGDRSIMIGAKAQSSVLEDSIVRLLRERSLQRLRLDVFVVPHGGSRSSVSKGLLGRIACNRYVISTSGAYFKHPHPETIARIILYGRTDPEAGVTLVFNYRSASSAMWDSPALRKRYQYDVVYPDTRAAGVTVRA